MDFSMEMNTTPRAANDAHLAQYFGGAPMPSTPRKPLSWTEADHHHGFDLFNVPYLDPWPENDTNEFVDVNHPIVMDDSEIDLLSDPSTTTDSESRGSSNAFSTGSLPSTGPSSYTEEADWQQFSATVTYSPHGPTEFLPPVDSASSIFSLMDNDHLSTPFLIHPVADVLSPTIDPATFNDARLPERSVGQIFPHPHPDSPALSASLEERPCVSISELNAPYIPNLHQSVDADLGLLSSSENNSPAPPSRKRSRSIATRGRGRPALANRRRVTTRPIPELIIRATSRTGRRAPSFTSSSSSELSDSPPIAKRPKRLPGKVKEDSVKYQNTPDDDGESDVSDSDVYSPSSSPSFDASQSDYSESFSPSSRSSRKPNKKALQMSAADALAQLSGSTSSATSMSMEPEGEWEPTDASGSTSSRRNYPIPIPVPVPHLTKKSRGRKVPYVNTRVARGLSVEDSYDGDDDGVGGRDGSSRRGRGGGRSGGGRPFVCTVEGCGKCFIRGEHLKRHVRSIHTNDKRELIIPTVDELD
ncbi:hypothetical protein DXG01_011347 [Tephrocybe rancida]|nr:hypothetical protein DXG01_011347 [Tephrocybe rancida]